MMFRLGRLLESEKQSPAQSLEEQIASEVSAIKRPKRDTRFGKNVALSFVFDDQDKCSRQTINELQGEHPMRFVAKIDCLVLITDNAHSGLYILQTTRRSCRACSAAHQKCPKNRRKMVPALFSLLVLTSISIKDSYAVPVSGTCATNPSRIQSLCRAIFLCAIWRKEIHGEFSILIRR